MIPVLLLLAGCADERVAPEALSSTKPTGDQQYLIVYDPDSANTFSANMTVELTAPLYESASDSLSGFRYGIVRDLLPDSSVRSSLQVQQYAYGADALYAGAHSPATSIVYRTDGSQVELREPGGALVPSTPRGTRRQGAPITFSGGTLPAPQDTMPWQNPPSSPSPQSVSLRADGGARVSNRPRMPAPLTLPAQPARVTVTPARRGHGWLDQVVVTPAISRRIERQLEGGEGVTLQDLANGVRRYARTEGGRRLEYDFHRLIGAVTAQRLYDGGRLVSEIEHRYRPIRAGGFLYRYQTIQTNHAGPGERHAIVRTSVTDLVLGRR
jgi:hypothetical protein